MCRMGADWPRPVFLLRRPCRRWLLHGRRSQTGVAQGIVLSPLLFILFVNVLARMLTAVGWQKGVEHEIRNIPGFNNLFFCDDLSMVASTERGMQQLLGVGRDVLKVRLFSMPCNALGNGGIRDYDRCFEH
jgi:hypothetical protein